MKLPVNAATDPIASLGLMRAPRSTSKPVKVVATPADAAAAVGCFSSVHFSARTPREGQTQMSHRGVVYALRSSDADSAPLVPPLQTRCPNTGYLMTKPFEQNNPMPGQFNRTCDYLVRQLKPVIKNKNAAAAAAAAPAANAGGEGGKKKEKKEKPAKTPQPQVDEDPFVKAKLTVAKVVEVGYVENSDKLYCCKVRHCHPSRDPLP